MIRFQSLLSFLLISAIALMFLSTSALASSRGIVPVPILNNKGEQVGLYKESHALIIGASDYKNGWPELPGVKGDVVSVRRALEKNGFNVEVVMNPDKRALLDAFDEFIIRHGQGADNRLLVYFAGHGHTMKLGYGGDMGYLVPVDAPNPNRDKGGFLASAVSMQQIEVYAKTIQSKHALFLFDSCFSGALFSMSRAVPEHISYKTSKPVRQFITAGRADEKVPDESVFRRQFLRALRGYGDMDGDGFVTGMELGEYLQKKVVNYSKGTQHPQYGKIRDPYLDEGDFVFALGANQTAKLSPSKEKDIVEFNDDSFKTAKLQPKPKKKPKYKGWEWSEKAFRLEEKGKYEEAFRWYFMAAEIGYYKAQYNVGWMYHKGRGVGQNDLEAYKWMALSVERNYKKAIPLRDSFAKKLSQTKKEDADFWVHNWYRKKEEDVMEIYGLTPK